MSNLPTRKFLLNSIIHYFELRGFFKSKFYIFFFQKHSESGRPLVGSFSAASNITGILNDTEAISVLMHKYGGYAFFDYATAGPYLFMDMNPNRTDM